ncbi:class I SAM-dependent methyltransferase [Metapseudomonas otitidis]|uniref:class I SAM-dependent methyltransferase n=1 Tax=Metapseudomonas otitidis TaxID=319939 RepID=UPI000D1A6A72|nr:class I SAM-dependent methyltransferase [Pseudomonas otitidis]
MTDPRRAQSGSTLEPAFVPASLDAAAPRPSLWRRLANWREDQVARRALRLAGEPCLVLDLPCGSGRFWPVLVGWANRIVIGADESARRLDVALHEQPANVLQRIRLLQTSAFGIDLGENAVDCIFCMRLMHRLGEPGQRLAMLREFHRVTRDTLILSLWVDGNYRAWRRRRLGRGDRDRHVARRSDVEAEFRQAGFEIIGHQDVLPGWAMWRVYTLRKVE